MTNTYKDLLLRYNILERVCDDLNTKSEEEAVAQYKAELQSIEDNWSNYSYDCVGHADMCLKLKIQCIENGYHRGQTLLL